MNIGLRRYSVEVIQNGHRINWSYCSTLNDAEQQMAEKAAIWNREDGYEVAIYDLDQSHAMIGSNWTESVG